MKRRNILATVLGTLAVIVLTVLSLMAMGLLGSRFLSLRLPGEAVVGLLPWLTPGVILAFVGFEAIFILLSPEVESGDLPLSSRPRKKADPRLKRRLILLILVFLLLLFAIVPNVQIVCDEEGITYRYPFFEGRSYSWDDVSLAAVADRGSAFSFKLKMKDGKTVDLMGYSTAETKPFVKTYEDMLGYMVFADGQLRAAGKFKTVKVSDSLLDSLRSRDDWERIAPIFEAH